MSEHPPIIKREIRDGHVVVFSDCHYWPGIVSDGHLALLQIVQSLHPEMVIANGDVLDGARISKHARIGWQHAPKLADELAACQERMNEVRIACPYGADLIWPLGNHDARFENFLANNAPEFAGIPGFTLKEHFPAWEPCWAVQLNDDVLIKHRWKGGINATLRNVIESGMNIVTGHLHCQRITPYTDYRETRWGVDCGTLANPQGPQFTAYLEAGPTNWRQGFICLTFKEGRLLWPEPIFINRPGFLTFRGEERSVR